MGQNNPAGSLWNKWDLHVHTPCSIVQGFGGDTDEVWDRFLSDLESLPESFRVLGINDYIFVDGYERVLREKREKGRLENIDLILPVIELRLDKFAGVVKRGADGQYSKSDWNRVNLHVIFDELDPEIIRQQFLSSLFATYQLIPESQGCRSRWQSAITRQSLTELGQMIIDSVPEDKRPDYSGPMQEGFNNLCFSLENVQSALKKHCLEDRFLLAVGKTEWDNMKWDDQSIAEKKHIINCAHIVFTASESPQKCENARKHLAGSKVLSKLFDCSDAHYLSDSGDKDRVGNCFTWVKADTTFAGLRQAVMEFDQRVFVGDTPPKKLLAASNKTKFISKITVTKSSDSNLTDEWFSADIPLNSDLVAIIGNKGSGKSALADITALMGNTRNYEHFSFLNEDRFCDPKTKLSSHFTATLHWSDDKISKKRLDSSVDFSSVERVKYLPQRHLEALCNQLAIQGDSAFDGELRKIIFTHFPKEKRIDCSTLEELLDFKISEFEVERDILLDKLEKVNEALVEIEKQSTAAHRETLTQWLEAMRDELTALESAKPTPVDDPHIHDSGGEIQDDISRRLNELEESIKSLRGEEKAALEKKAVYIKATAHIHRALKSIENYKARHHVFAGELAESLKDVCPDLEVENLISLDISTTFLEYLESEYRHNEEIQSSLLNAEINGSVTQRLQLLEDELKKLESQVSEKHRLYLVYKDQLEAWERARLALLGDDTTLDSIAGLEAQLKALDRLPQTRGELIETRRTIVHQLHDLICKIAAEYRAIYEPVQNFVRAATQMEMPLPLNFTVEISEEGFETGFLCQINRQARGTFYGVDGSSTVIRSLLKTIDFSNRESVTTFVEAIDDMLHFDRREKDNDVPTLAHDQKRKGIELKDVYNFVFGLSYLKPRYSLTYNDQQISQLSPGERGLLLLVFYLLVDKDDTPLVIDQPEENLDNQTIFSVLVACIKKAKERRQVIMVTHNPNLAVVCDAEQIIVASCDKSNNRFSYESGAIESHDIRNRVVEILEGTQPAFANRSAKYRLGLL